MCWLFSFHRASVKCEWRVKHKQSLLYLYIGMLLEENNQQWGGVKQGYCYLAEADYLSFIGIIS